MSNFLQFDSDNQPVVNINYNQFYYGISSQVIPSNIGPNLQDLEVKLVGDIYVQCNSDIDCPIGLFCEKNACRKPGLVSNHTIKGIQQKFPKNQPYIHLIFFWFDFETSCQKEPKSDFQFQNLSSSKPFWFF